MKKKGCLSIGCLVFVIFFIAVPVIFISQDPDKYNTDTKSKLARELGITSEQGESVIKTLTSVGIGEDVTIKHDEGLDNAHFEGEKGYRIDSQDASNIILYMNVNGTVNMIRYGDNTLFQNGKTLNKMNDFIVTKEEMTDLQIRCQNSLKSILKAPSTAKFPNITEWKFGKEDGITIVQSYVDSQNGYGAMIQSEFQFEIKDDKVISLILDGKEYIK